MATSKTKKTTKVKLNKQKPVKAKTGTKQKSKVTPKASKPLKLAKPKSSKPVKVKSKSSHLVKTGTKSKLSKKASKPIKAASKPAAKQKSKIQVSKSLPKAKVKSTEIRKGASKISKSADAVKKTELKNPKSTIKNKSKVNAASKLQDSKNLKTPPVKNLKSKSKKQDEDAEPDADVQDDYEKPDDDDQAVALDDDAAIMDMELPAASEPDEDDDEVPEKRGRGRRKKNDGRSSGTSMEAYIRNRPLQVDIHKTLINKSHLNEPKPYINQSDKRTRYSDKELAEFKKLILAKLSEAQADYDLLKQTLSNEDNHGTDDTSPTFKLLEDGSDVMSKEETAQLASRQEKYIVNLKNALIRIENKSYGICRVSGRLIPKERLRSVPHATLGIDAKLNQF